MTVYDTDAKSDATSIALNGSIMQLMTPILSLCDAEAELLLYFKSSEVFRSPITVLPAVFK